MDSNPVRCLDRIPMFDIKRVSQLYVQLTRVFRLSLC